MKQLSIAKFRVMRLTVKELKMVRKAKINQITPFRQSVNYVNFRVNSDTHSYRIGASLRN